MRTHICVQTNPEHHDSVQRLSESGNRSDEHQQERHDIDGQLELEELSDVVVDSSAPHNGLHDGPELVVQNNHICSNQRVEVKVKVTIRGVQIHSKVMRVCPTCCPLCDLGPTDAHGHAHVSGFECGCIIGAIPGHTHHLPANRSSSNPLIIITR